MSTNSSAVTITLPGISKDALKAPVQGVNPTLPPMPEGFKASMRKPIASPLKFSDKTILLQMFYASALEFGMMYNARIIRNLETLRLNSRYRPWVNLLLRPDRDMMGVGQDPRGNWISIVLRVNEHLAVTLCNNQPVYKAVKAQTGTPECNPFVLEEYMIDPNTTFSPNNPRGTEIIFRQYYHQIDASRFIREQTIDDEEELFGE
jgi:hypothetical protein